MLEGGKGKAILPDDQGDPGVEHRELAWTIATRAEYRNLLEFLQIRHFIVLTLKISTVFPTPSFSEEGNTICRMYYSRNSNS